MLNVDFEYHWNYDKDLWEINMKTEEKSFQYLARENEEARYVLYEISEGFKYLKGD